MNDEARRNTSLYKLWEHTRISGGGMPAPATPEEWNDQVFYLSTSGKGIEEALSYLYSNQPSHEEFLAWLLPEGISSQAASRTTGDLLTEDDWNDWERNGYLVIKNAIAPIEIVAAQQAIWAYLRASPSIPSSWYLPHEGKNGMMLNFFHHPALDNNRNSWKIRKIYEELYQGREIYLLVDKVSFNPPETKTYQFNGSPLHWDMSLHFPISLVLQGLLYLNDVGASDGAFQCVPGFHKKIEGWINSLPINIEPRQAALHDLKPVAVPGNAGDLVIWHHALPHCASPNKGLLPRMVQYIAYKPVKTADSTVWK